MRKNGPIGGATFYISYYREVHLPLSHFQPNGEENSDFWGKGDSTLQKSRGWSQMGSNKGKKRVKFCEFKKKKSSHEHSICYTASFRHGL